LQNHFHRIGDRSKKYYRKVTLLQKKWDAPEWIWEPATFPAALAVTDTAFNGGERWRPSVFCEPVKQALVNACCGNATIANDLSLCLWQQEHNNSEVSARQNDKKPKDPTPAQFLSKDAGDDRTKAWRCSSAVETKSKIPT
jgi:hypothetical protein